MQKKYICILCKPQHELHELIDLSKINYSEDSKKILEEQIKNIEKKLIDLDIIKEEIISEIDKIKKESELAMKFFIILVNTFKYEESLNNINYNVIHNLKNIEEIFVLSKSQLYEKIFKEGNKYISFLHNIRQSFGQTNLLKHNYKILNNHNDVVIQLFQLKDGRLMSCSSDSTLNIYKKDTFEFQLSIKEHSTWIISFTQLNND